MSFMPLGMLIGSMLEYSVLALSDRVRLEIGVVEGLGFGFLNEILLNLENGFTFWFILLKKFFSTDSFLNIYFF